MHIPKNTTNLGDYSFVNAERFLKEANASLSSSFIETRYYFPEDKYPRDVFKCKLITPLGNYTFTYGDSLHNTATGNRKKPNTYAILACLDSSPQGTFEEFCSSYGYDDDSWKSFKTYKACVEESEALNKIFTTNQLEVLSNIF